ncbi:MAG TPA: hypothetical protein VEV82_11455 [Actinomycetota bacterium]|nr:hypothetical protein [Actinomycetota bacterium]
MRFSKSTKLWALAMLFVLAFAACGSDSETPTEDAPAEDPAAEEVTAQEFVSTLCTEMQNWITSLQEGQAEVQANVEPGNAESGKQALAAFFDGAIAATDSLVAAIEGAGTPGVDGGAEVQQELVTKFQEARDALQSARDQVDSLPTDDPQAFADAAEALGQTIQTQLSAIGDALSSLSQAELDEAAQTEPACTSLTTTGG